MFSSLFKSFTRCEKGATAIEYGLIAAGIAVAISAVVFTMGDSLEDMFDEVDTQLSTAATNAAAEGDVAAE